MPRNVIYQGDIPELLERMKNQYLGDHECVALPQALTDVGHTSRWQPGPRVVDLNYLLPGAVIANFKRKAGAMRFPNEHGYHAALFIEFGPRNGATGGYDYIWVVDQWQGQPVKRRHKLAYPPEQAKRERRAPADNANEFYVVVVP
jgi:hypothetical protein